MKDEVGADAHGASSFILHPSSFSSRVVKLGGSLLTWAAWPAAFRRWLAMQSNRRTVVIVGGGSAVDAVRDWDREHRLDPSDAHWLAINAMSLTCRFAARMLPEAAWTDDWSLLFAAGGNSGRAIIFDSRRFLQKLEPAAGGTPLIQSWDVTSDSIAARIAALLSCELVLLKSSLPELQVATLDEAATAGFVDRCFPHFAAELPLVRMVNLRDDDFAEVRWGATAGVPAVMP